MKVIELNPLATRSVTLARFLREEKEGEKMHRLLQEFDAASRAETSELPE